MRFFKKYREHFIYRLTSLVFVILIFMLCTYILIIRHSARLTRENTLELNHRLLEQTEHYLQDTLGSLHNVAAAFCYSPAVLQCLSQDSPDYLQEGDALTFAFSNTLLLNDHILSAYLYNTDLQQVAAVGKEFPLSKDKLELCSSMEIRTEPLTDQNELYYKVLFPIYNLVNAPYQNALGMCVFIMEPKALDDILKDSKATQNSTVFLLDENDQILICTKKGKQGFILPEQEQKSNSSHYFCSRSLSMNKWRIASLIPEEDLNQPDRMLNHITIAVLMISLMLFCILIIYCNWQITFPMQQITKFIQNVNKAPSERLALNRRDEVGIVANSLNQMLDENQKFQEKFLFSQQRILEAELATKQAELLAYRSQINPHFLYNTFECIRGMALYHDEDDIADITMALSNVFRFAIKGEDIVSVEEELEHILEYAKIIEYRFMGKISINISANQEVREKKILKLFLQPLVENAVFHGLEQKMTRGSVQVSITEQNDSHLCFIVKDDGCGIEPEKLNGILRQLNNHKSSSKIGLFNIYQRLKLFYGDRFEFEIESEPNRGTRITILIPDEITELSDAGGEKNDDFHS
ncbi:MAG: sensor histidine kinase [Lachnospiraceae bacterium]|nr:sensor histidine kinase [Lachnospiraceae bacterium]